MHTKIFPWEYKKSERSSRVETIKLLLVERARSKQEIRLTGMLKITVTEAIGYIRYKNVHISIHFR